MKCSSPLTLAAHSLRTSFLCSSIIIQHKNRWCFLPFSGFSFPGKLTATNAKSEIISKQCNPYKISISLSIHHKTHTQLVENFGIKNGAKMKCHADIFVMSKRFASLAYRYLIEKSNQSTFTRCNQ